MPGAAPGERPRGAAAVTGLGLATSLGFGVTANWQRLLAGESGVQVLDAARFALPVNLPVLLGAPVDRDALAAAIREAVPRSVWNTSAEVTHLWLLAALEALQGAGLPPEAGPPERRRIGVFVGTGAGAQAFTEQEYIDIYTAQTPAQCDIPRMAIPKFMSSALAAQLCIHAGLQGPSQVVETACSSGAAALLAALDALRLGRVDCAVAGGVDLALTAATLKGFAHLGALTPRHDLGAQAGRPFAADRAGFVLGEGAAALILERPEAARAREATALALLRGGAATSEAAALLAPARDGTGMAACMEEALQDAALPAASVAHVYAHGTGTRYNDACEAAALARVLPHGPTVSATKAQLGHTIGAGGAIDAVLAVLGLREGRVVAQHHLAGGAPGPDCPVEPARAAEQPALGVNGTASVMVDSFAFGGHNASLLFTGA